MLNDVIQKNLFDTVEYRSDRKVPALIRGFTTFIIYLLASFGIIAFVFDFKITGLVATSGILMMIIGLAIQLNIANIFSGIALNLERPYHVGDWVKVGGYSEGRVIDINWRTTRFEDKLGCVFAIPNSTAAESFIHNFSLPTDLFNDWITVYIDPEHDPKIVKDILLQAVTEVKEHVLKEPACWVSFSQITDTSAVYLVGWSAMDYRAKYSIRQLVWLSIWKNLDKARIKPAIRRQAIKLQRDDTFELPEPLLTKPVCQE
jgi:branched-chain amino acid transport system substrate-binding protein